MSFPPLYILYCPVPQGHSAINTAPSYLSALLTLTPPSGSKLCVPELILPILAVHVLEGQTQGSLTPHSQGTHSTLCAAHSSFGLIQHLVSWDVSAVCSWLPFSVKISLGVLFFTINIFHEIIREAGELTLGEQCGSCMVKVDSS